MKGNTMRVSDLEFTTEMSTSTWAGHRVEMPKTDALRYVSSDKAATDFIAEFGDVEIVLDEKYGHYAVPAFKVERDEYCKLKQAHCEIYGSN